MVYVKQTCNVSVRQSIAVHLDRLRTHVGRIPKSPVLTDVKALAVLALVTLVAIYREACFRLAVGTVAIRATWS